MISGKRIRTLGNHFRMVPIGAEVTVGITIDDETRAILEGIGFTHTAEIGECVLPDSAIGRVCDFNANGSYVVHRDQPMETAYRQSEWHWKEWHGQDTVEQSKIVDVPYQRYPRTFVPPPSVELRIATDAEDNLFVVSPRYLHNPEHAAELVHVVNIFLEVFGHCSVFSGDIEPLFRAPLKRLNWTVLPPGRRPWEQLRLEVAPMIERAPLGNQPVILQRLETLNNYEPEFLAVGQAGFGGYVVFGFPAKDIFVLESIFVGNATYVFGEDWESLSQRTKAEILSGHLQQARIIHRDGWDTHVRDLFVD
ncbi:MAG: hypothetical protein IH963_01790 [Chloroflexi bacterium]|nr:hypothetical protein [Chloroflexota bacterium]